MISSSSGNSTKELALSLTVRSEIAVKELQENVEARLLSQLDLSSVPSISRCRQHSGTTDSVSRQHGIQQTVFEAAQNQIKQQLKKA